MRTARAGDPTPGVDVEYVGPPPQGRRIGIALSGGGIRSAAFNLGALQALQEVGIMQSADYLAAVSGGNYIASAMTISHALGKGDDADAASAGGAGADAESKAYWGHGSPEERYLRRYVNYLAPGYVGRVWLGMSVVFGFVVNYLPFLLGAFVIGRLLGWLVNLTGPLVDLPATVGIAVPAPLLFLLVPVSVLAGALVLVGARRLKDDWKGAPGYTKRRTETVVAILVSLAGAILLVLLLPALAAGYGAASRALVVTVLGGSPGEFDTAVGRLAVAAAWLMLTLVLAVLAIVLSGRTRARRTMLIVSALAGAGLLLVPLLSSLDFAARFGLDSVLDGLAVLAAIAVMFLMAVGVHNRRYSLHSFYRERLNSAFALQRKNSTSGRTVAAPIDYATRLDFSRLGARLAENRAPMPKLVVCCAVNITTADVPVGRYAESFTFEYDQSGGPRFGYGETTRLETARGLRGTALTLPSLMAVSGAALSPLMGRFTYPPLRFLMALTNVRLGVWIINPDHDAWRKARPVPTTVWGRLVRAIAAGWHEPGAMYVLREAVGGLDLSRRFIYLTDGGHWENLGLVELMRRRCTDLVCFDASASQNGVGQDLGRAIAIARSDLGADVDLDPRPTIPGPDGLSAASAVRGSITYADGSTARLVYAPATMSADSGWDLLALRKRDSRFPNHSTAQQIFTDELFEAYRTLGHASGARAAKELNIPSAQLRTTARPPAAAEVADRVATDKIASMDGWVS
ncbi:MAG: hypothetical protein L0K86_11660 [Actinomycetia bacterium]|nr:hypothetical protein [Actinomycetes bacterium]